MSQLKVDVRRQIEQVLSLRGITRKELAERLGVGLPRISQMLSGADDNLTLQMLERIGDACGVDFQLVVAYRVLAGPRGTKERKRSVSTLDATPQALEGVSDADESTV